MTALARTLAIGAVTALAFALLHAPARALRREVLVDRALDALCDALDKHAARTGSFPDGPLLSGGELARLLRAAGDLDAIPLNPDTAHPFGTVDLETDLFFCELEPAGYRVEVLGPDGAEVVAVRVTQAR